MTTQTQTPKTMRALEIPETKEMQEKLRLQWAKKRRGKKYPQELGIINGEEAERQAPREAAEIYEHKACVRSRNHTKIENAIEEYPEMPAETELTHTER